MTEGGRNELEIISRKIFLGIWLIPTIFFSLIGMYELISTGKWKFYPTTNGTVLNSSSTQIETQMPSGKSYRYENNIEYNYKIDGVLMTGKKFSNQEIIRLDTVKYAINTPIEVHYSPFDHEYAVIEVRWNADRVMAIFLSAFMWGAYFIMKLFIDRIWKRKES